MLSFISNQQNSSLTQSSAHENEEEIKSLEAMQGDTALITAVNELNELREVGEIVNA